MKKAIVLSNNPLVWAEFPSAVKFHGTLRQLLVEARNMIHQGMRLVSHPLAGSIKPNQTPYKTLILGGASQKVDLTSLLIIESAINTVDKLPPLDRNWDELVMDDFQLIDLTLLQSAMEGIGADLILKK